MARDKAASEVEDTQREFSRVVGAFRRFTKDERQLLLCALAGNHPERLAPLRPKTLRALARADKLEGSPVTPVLPKSGAFPSDDMIVLAALLEGQEWRQAEDIASTLRRLGFEISPQKMVGQLKRLAAEDLPMIEGRLGVWQRINEYRVTRYGRTQLSNHFAKTYALSRPNTRGGG